MKGLKPQVTSQISMELSNYESHMHGAAQISGTNQSDKHTIVSVSPYFRPLYLSISQCFPHGTPIRCDASPLYVPDPFLSVWILQERSPHLLLATCPP